MSDLPPSLLALNTYLLSKVGKSARGRLGERLAARELRLWHIALLAALADFGPQAQRVLATRLGLDPSDVTKALDDLEGAGQVVRVRDTADRRRVLVEISAAGRTALRDLMSDAQAVEEEVLAPLNTEERALLHVLLQKLFLNSP